MEEEMSMSRGRGEVGSPSSSQEGSNEEEGDRASSRDAFCAANDWKARGSGSGASFAPPLSRSAIVALPADARPRSMICLHPCDERVAKEKRALVRACERRLGGRAQQEEPKLDLTTSKTTQQPRTRLRVSAVVEELTDERASVLWNTKLREKRRESGQTRVGLRSNGPRNTALAVSTVPEHREERGRSFHSTRGGRAVVQKVSWQAGGAGLARKPSQGARTSPTALS